MIRYSFCSKSVGFFPRPFFNLNVKVIVNGLGFWSCYLGFSYFCFFSLFREKTLKSLCFFFRERERVFVCAWCVFSSKRREEEDC